MEEERQRKGKIGDRIIIVKNCCIGIFIPKETEGVIRAFDEKYTMIKVDGIERRLPFLEDEYEIKIVESAEKTK